MFFFYFAHLGISYSRSSQNNTSSINKLSRQFYWQSTDSHRVTEGVLRRRFKCGRGKAWTVSPHGTNFTTVDGVHHHFFLKKVLKLLIPVLSAFASLFCAGVSLEADG